MQLHFSKKKTTNCKSGFLSNVACCHVSFQNVVDAAPAKAVKNFDITTAVSFF
jgi:hypothetical protein